jgi:flagellin
LDSVNTNRAALQALQAVNANAAALREAQGRVATGLRVASAKDDGAIWGIAKLTRSEADVSRAVTDSLNRGRSILDTAAGGVDQISDLLDQLNQKALAYSDTSLGPSSKAALQADIQALVDRLDRTATGTTFDGINLLTGKPGVSTVTTKSYAATTGLPQPASFGTPIAALPNGVVANLSYFQTLGLPFSALTPPSFSSPMASAGSGSDTFTRNAGSAAGRVDLLLDAYGVPDVVEIYQNGVRVAATGQPYVPGGGAVAAGASVSNQNVLSFDYDPAAGQNIEFRFNDGGAPPGTAWSVGGLALADASDPLPTGPVVSSTTTNRIAITTVDINPPPVPPLDAEGLGAATGSPPTNAAQTIPIDPGPAAGRIDLSLDAYSIADKVEIWQNGVRVAATGQAYAAAGGAVGAAAPVSGLAQLSFDYDPARGPIELRFNAGGAQADSAWMVTELSLQPTSAPAIPVAVTQGVQTAQIFSPWTYDFLSSTAADDVSVTTRDMTARGLGLDPLTWSNPAGLISAFKSAMTKAVAAGAYFGERQNTFELVNQAVGRTRDVMSTGAGNLVDADLAREAARLQALQTRQSLSMQVLSIANARPQWLLNLFTKGT